MWHSVVSTCLTHHGALQPEEAPKIWIGPQNGNIQRREHGDKPLYTSFGNNLRCISKNRTCFCNFCNFCNFCFLGPQRSPKTGVFPSGRDCNRTHFEQVRSGKLAQCVPSHCLDPNGAMELWNAPNFYERFGFLWIKNWGIPFLVSWFVKLF